MLNVQDIKNKLAKFDNTFETYVQSHKYRITKCKLTGQDIILKSWNADAIVLGKVIPDGRKSYAYVIMIISNNAKYCVSRSDFKIKEKQNV